MFQFWRFFSSKKFFFTIKLLLKLDRQKITKILPTVLNPEDLELLECALVITFVNENR